MKVWGVYFAAFLTTLGGLAYVFLGLAPEGSQGLVQKIFFFHVPSAFMMYLFLIIGAFSSCLYLYNKKSEFDRWGRAGMYTATLFSIIVLTSGPIWAKPIWGVYWAWDPRLTTSFVVFILLLGYCFVRQIYEERDHVSKRGPLLGAIIAILAVIDIPLIHFSVKLWRGVHPSVLNNKEGLPDTYRTALELMILAWLFLGLLFFILFSKVLWISEQSEKLKLSQIK